MLELIHYEVNKICQHTGIWPQEDGTFGVHFHEDVTDEQRKEAYAKCEEIAALPEDEIKSRTMKIHLNDAAETLGGDSEKFKEAVKTILGLNF